MRDLESLAADLESIALDARRDGQVTSADVDLIAEAAAALSELAQPAPLQSRSEYRALFSRGYDREMAGSPQRTRDEARATRPAGYDLLGLEHRTVVESEWRPVRG